MTANIATRIATKAEQATKTLESVQAKALQLAQAGTTNADEWASYANEVAAADGAATAWLRVLMMVGYCDREGIEITPAVVLDVVLELTLAGADDSWSGRGNDVRRARFDGIRKACTEMKYIAAA